MANHPTRRPAAPSAARGFGLVETMVALVIGLLATFIIMQVFATSEGVKRTTGSGAEAQSDAAVVLYLLERDLRQAGYGLAPNPEDFVPSYTPPPTGVLTNGILAQCTTVRAYNKNRATTVDFAYANSTFAPIVINPPGYPAADANTDIVLVNYGSTGGMIGKGIVLTNQSGNTQTGGNVTDYVVDTAAERGVTPRAGFQQGDMILAVPPPLSNLDCSIGEITGLPNRDGTGCTVAPTDSTEAIVNHNDVAYPSYYVNACDPAKTVNAVWNKAGGGVEYNQGSKLYNLGPVGSFVSRVYAVRKGNLTMCDLTANDCMAAVADPPNPNVWMPIASGVVGLRAQYGIDTDLNGVIDAWQASPQPTGTTRAQVAAVRLAVVAKSKQYEKTTVTAAAPVWGKDATSTSDVNIDTSAWPSDWQRYRYKTVQSIVPLRNMIWGQQH